MKQKTVILVLVLVALALGSTPTAVLMANPVGKDDARQKALSFISERWPAMARGAQQDLTLALTNESYHVFNVGGDLQSLDGGGFVIVSGDDCTDEILGYTDSGTFNAQDMPENLRAWLQGYADQIAWTKANSIGTPPVSARATTYRAPKSSIDPLIKTKWNQGSSTEGGYIYNTMCPEIDGKRCLTGCVPTAGAQVMYYYQHPKGSTGEVPGYESDLAATANPLPPTTFKWDMMKTEYTKNDEGTDSAKAVAELMAYCGYVAKTNYGLDGSGASSFTMALGMAEHFGYDAYTLKSVSRTNYKVSDWEAIIYDELQQGRPVIYSGSSVNSGHTFICDGYDGEGLYHFNWGWGGSYNGYFTLQATNPYGIARMDNYGYIFYQSAVIGIQPNTGIVPEDPSMNDESEPEPEPDGIVAVVSNLRVEGTAIIMRGSNTYDEEYCFGFGIAELMSDGTLIPVDTTYARYDRTTLKPGYGFPNLKYDLTLCNLTEGEHTIVAISKLYGDDTWRQCTPSRRFYQVSVDADSIKDIVMHPIEQIMVNRFEVVSPRMPYTSQNVALSITNEGDFYEKGLAIYLGTEDNVGDYAAYKKVAIAPGNTKEYSFSVNKYDDDGNSLLSPGDYVLRLCVYGYTETVFAETSMKIEQNLELASIELTGNRLIQSIQPIVAKVKSNAGDYTKPLYMFASQTDVMGECVYMAGAAIEGGQTGDVVFYFAPQTEGEWNIWVATDELGTDVIGHKTVTFESLKVKSFEVKGCQFANVKHKAELIMDNPGGEYSGRMYLFASMTNEKGSYTSSKETTFKANGSTTETFTFTPKSSGDWHVWLCTDWKGEDVVTQTDVHVYESPEGRVRLQEVSSGVAYTADSVIIDVTMKNVGDITNYRELFARILEGDSVISWYYGDPVTIEPGQEGRSAVKFGKLEKGKVYTVRYFYFYDCAGSYIVNLGTQEVSLPEGLRGDINGDSIVDVADIATVIDIMAGNGQGPSSADVNGDGVVDVADIADIIDIMAGND